MLRTIGILVQYGVSMGTLTALALAIRYAASWSPTLPVDPTRSAITLRNSPQETELRSPCLKIESNQDSVWQVAFVTDRGNAQLSGPLQGLIDVIVPSSRSRGAFSIAEADSRHEKPGLSLRHRSDLSRDNFLEHLSRQLDAAEASGSGRDLLIFVHGYNVSFEESVARVAQMAHDMPFTGVIVAFDWASQAEAWGYFHDRWTVDRSYLKLAKLLDDLHGRFDEGTRIHVLSHSMGNRLTLHALRALEEQRTLITDRRHHGAKSEISLLQPQFPHWPLPGSSSRLNTPLRNLVFMAPDVDPQEFSAGLGVISGSACQMTLYCSDSDFALEMSRFANGHGRNSFRSGDSRTRLRMGNLHTVQVTGVNRNDPFGHAYYGSHPGILSDLAALLLHDLPPDKRMTLVSDRAGDSVWRMR